MTCNEAGKIRVVNADTGNSRLVVPSPARGVNLLRVFGVGEEEYCFYGTRFGVWVYFLFDSLHCVRGKLNIIDN